MSDFLRHLVQRAVAPAAVGVQPRLASRFEAAPAPARFAEEHIETVAPAPPPAPVVSRTVLPPPPARFDITAPPAPPLPASPTVAPPAAAISSATPVAPPPIPPVAPILFTPPAQTPVPAPALDAFVAAAPRVEPAPTLQPSVNTLLVERVTEHVRETHVAPPIAPAPPPQTREHLSPVSPTPTIINPAAVSSASTTVAPTPASQPPTVRVHIGRIDIRAVATPPAALARPAAAPRSPLVSLEEYLRQRTAS